MSAQHPHILYIGDTARGNTFLTSVKSRNWVVYLPQQTLEALGMYITYLPDIVVIDTAAQPSMAVEAYHHLRSVEAGPLLVLTDDPKWDVSADRDVIIASPHISDLELIEIIGDTLLESLEPVTGYVW